MNDLNQLKGYVISRKNRMIKLLEKDLQNILETIAQDTVKKIKVFIRQYWYNRYTPKNYERTESLYNSVRYSIIGKSIYIYFDLDSAKRKEGNRDEWGSYTNFQDDPSFTGDFWESMIEYIDTGRFIGGYGSLNNPRLGDGINFIDKTERWLNKYLKNKVDKEIKVFLKNRQIL